MIANAIGLTCGVRHLLPWAYTIFLAGLLVRRLRPTNDGARRSTGLRGTPIGLSSRIG
jgi:hypothetical protein